MGLENYTLFLAEASPFFLTKMDILNAHKSNDHRTLLVSAKLKDELLTIINVYVPNKESDILTF